jgi:hypothetical protein
MMDTAKDPDRARACFINRFSIGHAFLPIHFKDMLLITSNHTTQRALRETHNCFVHIRTRQNQKQMSLAESADAGNRKIRRNIAHVEADGTLRLYTHQLGSGRQCNGRALTVSPGNGNDHGANNH